MALLFSINNIKVGEPDDYDYELTPVVTDENRNEQAKLSLRPVAHKHKSTWTYNYILGDTLIKILGESWEKYVGNKTYKFNISMPSYSGGQLEYQAYFKAINFKIAVWNDNPNLRIYSGFTMTWIEY